MEKPIYSVLISAGVSSVFTVLLIVIGVKVRNLFVPFILVSDFMIFIFYKNEILNAGNPGDDAIFYIFLYYAFSVVFCIICVIYSLSKERSGRCICKSCRAPDYEEIKSENE